MAEKMSEREHVDGVGAVVTNLQSLETVIRIFLAKLNNQSFSLPSPGDQFASENYLTNYRSLGSLIDEYNRLLLASEVEFRVDRSVVDVRDAFAHGRLLSVGDVYPATLYKFSIAQGGKVAIEFQNVLTKEWLNSTKLMIRDEQMKVVKCYKARGYKGF